MGTAGEGALSDASVGGFAVSNPYAVLRVRADGWVEWANAQGMQVLADWGDLGTLPPQLIEEIASMIASGVTHTMLLGGAGDPAFEVNLAPDGGLWLHARAESDAVAEQVRSARRTKSAFLANMSHELRTPLNAIIGYADLLQEEARDMGAAGLVPDLERVNRAADHLLRLINDILDVSKIEAGRMGLLLETFSVASLVDDVVNTLQPLLLANDNELLVSVEVSPAEVRTDRTKMRQVLFNLLDNACKFTRSGTITLSVRSEVYSGEGCLVWSVRDTGIGLGEGQGERLFEPFTQADSSSTRRYGGTGLGLAMCRLLTQMLGGRIEASGRPGEGCLFTVRHPQHLQMESGPQMALPGVEVTGPVQGTVLVIDDDPSVRDLVARYLAKEGYRALLAADGETGLQLARDARPDAITLDVMMPQTDGWEVLRRLKADPDVGDIPVVMLSIIDNTGLGFALGATEYLTKPVDRASLIGALAPFLNHGRVLVVDDDPDQRNLMARTLGRAGWDVVEAEDGAAALRWLEDNVPDVIVLDLLMPGVDGFAVVEAVRQRPAWRDVPVVVLTAKDLTPADRLRLQGSVQTILDKGGGSLDRIVLELRNLLGER